MPTGSDATRKLHPKLRTVKNGDRTVNAHRALTSATVATAAPAISEEPALVDAIEELAHESRTNLQAAVRDLRAPMKVAKSGRRAKLKDLPAPDDSFVNVFVEFYTERAGVSADEQRERIAELTLRMEHWTYDAARGAVDSGAFPRRNIVCATVPISKLEELSRDPAVAFVHAADPLKFDLPAVTAAAKPPKPKAIGDAKRYGRGDGVLIGIIDVGGFDFAHADFLRGDDTTRFVAIWDQGGDFRRPPSGFDYGSEFREERLNAAIAAAKKPGMPPAVMIERQSQMEPSSHATHVASIAAGNSGVCPAAEMAAVLIDVPLPADDLDRRRWTFSDTSRITHAVEYLLRIAEERKKPIAINISLGTNGGAHDGSSGVSRWLDAYLATPGRAICVAAGNAGQESAQEQGDLGWIMGRVHTSGTIPSRGLEVELEWTVIGNGIEDLSENELEIWYSEQDRFIVSIKAPGEDDWIEVRPREFVENKRLRSGTHVSAYNELYHPTNGANYIAVYLSPDLKQLRGIQAGVWKIRIKGEEIRDGRFNAWIERDDPGEIGRDAGRRLFRFPSFFSEKSNVDSHSISSLACGHRVISVANLDDARERIHVSSSQGPTRDQRCKPEIAGPGTDIVAANGFGAPDEAWVAMTGTSMACPYVTGVVGLILAANPDITAAQCAGILQRTARPLAGASYAWANDAGWGRIDPQAAIDEARAINARTERR